MELLLIKISEKTVEKPLYLKLLEYKKINKNHNQILSRHPIYNYLKTMPVKCNL